VFLAKVMLEVEAFTPITLLAVNMLKEFGLLVEVAEEKVLLVAMLLLLKTHQLVDTVVVVMAVVEQQFTEET
jgi:hypothetical protein